MDWRNVSSKDIIRAACNSENWTDDEFLRAVGERTSSNDAFVDALYDALNAAGLDSVTFSNLARDAVKRKEKSKGTPIADLVSAAEIEEQETEWLIPGFIPRYQITVLAGDGGVGKTTIECALAAAITTGKPCFMSQNIPFEADPEKVLFLSGEDDFARVLKRKLRIAGADMRKIVTVRISSGSFNKLLFGSKELEQVISEVRPGLVLFDPLQHFVPKDIQMGQRNAMRQCLSTLIGMGELYGTTFIIVCHSNKQVKMSGRRRISESADIWDIARSVLMVGDTGEDGLKYLSHEKSNYGELQRTILYSLDGESVILRGYSDLKDADYVREERLPRPAPARKEAKELLVQTLKENGGRMKSFDLDNVLKGMGISGKTLERAKTELKGQKVIQYSLNGFGGEWETSLIVGKDEGNL